MKLGICQLCEEEKNLIEAHVVPRKYTPDYAASYSATLSYPSRRPKGLYDDSILCGSCDGNILGPLDELSYDFFLTQPDSNIAKIFFKLANHQNYKLHKFVYSLMWRASISTRSDTAKSKLGYKHEMRLKDLILETKEIDIYEYPIIMSYLINFPAKDKILGIPYAHRYKDGINYVDIILDRYIVSVKVDKRKHILYQKGQNRILGENNKILMLEENWDTSKNLRKSVANSLKINGAGIK